MNPDKSMREKIKSVFLAQAEKNNYCRVSVTAVCQACHIHRSTFYFYFESIDGLLDEIEYDFIRQIPFVDCFTNKEALYEGTLNYVKYVSRNKRVFFTLIKSGKLIPAFMDKSNEKSSQFVMHHFGIDNHEMPPLLASYTTIGSIALLQTWLTDYPEYPAKKIAQIICNQAIAATQAI